MKKMLNTLFVTTEDAYLALDGENVVIRRDDEQLGRFPLRTLEGIMSFSYTGASPALLGACAERGIAVSFFSANGRFLAGVHGQVRGNVLLRKAQYEASQNKEKSLEISKRIIQSKVYNSRLVLERTLRDHVLQIDSVAVSIASDLLKKKLKEIEQVETLDVLRGFEGICATIYFGVFDNCITQDKKEFSFQGRTRRPPMDKVNALLSFCYSIATNDCVAALEGVGLDPYVGFMHVERPGRPALALDLVEEFRALLVDRFVLFLINNRMVNGKHFEVSEDGATLLNKEGRRIVLSAWQERKKEAIQHPFLEERIPRGLFPYAQALLLARFLRGDLDSYPAYLGAY